MVVFFLFRKPYSLGAYVGLFGNTCILAVLYLLIGYHLPTSLQVCT
jgi:hypothetical protein